MNIERLLVAFSIATLIFTFVHVGSAVVSVQHVASAPEVVRAPPDAKALLKKLETLDERLREAQASIDQVLAKLSTAHEASEVEATRVRLDVLFRLESGLTADIARTRDALSRVSAR